MLLTLLAVLFDALPHQATYNETPGLVKSQRFLPTFCKDVPTHVVFGEIADLKCALSLPVTEKGG